MIRAEYQDVVVFCVHLSFVMANLRLIGRKLLFMFHDCLVIDRGDSEDSRCCFTPIELDTCALVTGRQGKQDIKLRFCSSMPVHHLLLVDGDKELRVLVEKVARRNSTAFCLWNGNFFAILECATCAVRFKRHARKDSDVEEQVFLALVLVEHEVDRLLYVSVLTCLQREIQHGRLFWRVGAADNAAAVFKDLLSQVVGVVVHMHGHVIGAILFVLG